MLGGGTADRLSAPCVTVRRGPNRPHAIMGRVQRLSSEVLENESYLMPAVGSGETGLAWLRAHVARFCDGPEHARRRGLTVARISAVEDAPYDTTPTRTLLRALGLPPDAETDVDLVAQSYQPHAPQSEDADAAADRLVALCGGRTDDAAAVVCVLVQAHAAVRASVRLTREGSAAPPVPTTRRRAPDGDEVEVDLTDAPFGRGAHACPGEALARRLVAEAVGQG